MAVNANHPSYEDRPAKGRLTALLGARKRLTQRAQALPFSRGDDNRQAAIRRLATGAEMV
jgi:hypothetical protein